MKSVPTEFDAHAFFVKALQQATPKKKQELSDALAKWNITFTLDEKSVAPDFWAVPSTGEINVPRRCLFRIKAHAFADFAVMNALVAKHSGTDDEELETQLSSASDLLTWAVRTDIAIADDDGSEFSLGEVPSEFEAQCNSCLSKQHAEIAEEVFRLAVLWILHHEIAHVRLQHPDAPGPDAAQEEYEADRAAIDWLVDDNDLSASERLSHRLAVAVGLGWLAAFNVYLGTGEADTHPPECERFIAGTERLAKAGGDEAEWAWSICQAILLLHMRNAGIQVQPSDMAGSFEDIARRLAKLIGDAG